MVRPFNDGRKNEKDSSLTLNRPFSCALCTSHISRDDEMMDMGYGDDGFISLQSPMPRRYK
jgi:hypothetical protein